MKSKHNYEQSILLKMLKGVNLVPVFLQFIFVKEPRHVSYIMDSGQYIKVPACSYN